MDEINVRLDTMRDAAAKMRRATLKLQASVSVVQNLIATLPPAMRAEAIAQMGGSPQFSAAHWLDDLLLFARKLEQASVDIEKAASAEPIPLPDTSNLPYFGMGMTLGYLLPRILGNHEEAPDLIREKEQPFIGEYVSISNRPLYEQLMSSKETLREQQERLAYLTLLHGDKESDLVALENRLATEGVTNIQAIPRVQAMKDELHRIEQEMDNLHGSIHSTETNILDIQERLSRVTPGPGANLALIRLLEHSETIDAIKRHTDGCVNYIVNKMPIPPGIPSDAYLWNDNALKFREYGITSGDTPLPGSVIVFEREHSWANDVYGHLMYVERVDHGQVWITDNYHPDVPVRLSDVTSEVSGPNITYLYFPWHTKVI